ncbi:MAG: phage capsid protein [Sulfuritalea sp.]|nr:phage capsid protein [Sulfuritalea sp.]
MSDITVAHAQKFAADYYMLSEQKDSRFSAFVRNDPDFMNIQAKVAHYNRIGNVEMRDRTTRNADTPIMDVPHSRRRISMTDKEFGALVDKNDAVRLMANPTNAYVMKAVRAANRERDRVILTAVDGTAKSMDSDDAATDVALPAGQKIAVDGTGLTLDKILESSEILGVNEADDDQEFVWAIGPKQRTDLFGLTEFKSADFNGQKPMVIGANKNTIIWMGFTFKVSNLLTLSGTSRLTKAWAATAIGFARGLSAEPKVYPRGDKSLNVQILIEEVMGATRVEDELVLQTACLE